MAGRKRISKKLLCIKNMPELKHAADDGEFDIHESEVVQWLIQQPHVLQWLFDAVKSRSGKNQLIAYDPDKRTWRGVNHQ